MKYLLILASLLVTTNALASGFSSLGLATSYFQENQAEYKTHYEPKLSVTFNHVVDVNDMVTIGYSTNRLDNLIAERKSYDIKLSNGIKGVNQQKITHDTFLFGKMFDWGFAAATAGNVRVDNRFVINNSVKRKINHAIIYGATVTRFINDKYSVSLAGTLPNEELNIDYGITLIIGFKL